MFILLEMLVEITDTQASMVMCKSISPKSKMLASTKVCTAVLFAVSNICCESFAKDIYAREAIRFKDDIKIIHGINGLTLS